MLKIRQRGTDISRIEGLSDGVFGFAVTLLVVSLDVPRSFNQLIAAMAGVPAFIVSAVVLFGFWSQQHRFFRRYGMTDGVTLVLNLALLLAILIYIYPLKFMLSLTVEGMTHHWHVSQWTISQAELPLLFAMYAAGFAVVSLFMALMHLNALRLRAELALEPHEVQLTVLAVVRNLTVMTCAGLATLLATQGSFFWWLPFLFIAPVIALARRWMNAPGQQAAPDARPPER